jgi:hypothetical protein
LHFCGNHLFFILNLATTNSTGFLPIIFMHCNAKICYKIKKSRSGIPNQLQKHSNAFLDGYAAAPMDSSVANKNKVAHPDYDTTGSVQQKAGSQANMAQGCGQKII